MSQKNYCFRFRNRRGLIFFKINEVYDDRKLFKGETIIEELDAYIDKGKTYHPYAHLPDICNIAISKKFRDTLSDNNITGWRTYRINITGSDHEYYGLQILGKAGLVKRPSKPGWVQGLKIDMSQWDGSDFFSAMDATLIMFTEKVKNALLLSKLFLPEEFVDLDEFEWYSA